MVGLQPAGGRPPAGHSVLYIRAVILVAGNPWGTLPKPCFNDFRGCPISIGGDPPPLGGVRPPMNRGQEVSL